MLKRFWGDARIVFQLVAARKTGATHAQRLESFYRGQAAGYDDFRERLLQGRRELIAELPWETADNGVWIDLGGGTGANLEFAHEMGKLSKLKAVYLVDLCPSLLAVARARIAKYGWKNVHAIEADATTFVPTEGAADLVTFSYSLTMIPDWMAAIDQAAKLLKPGGAIGTVDFWVARKHDGRHGWWTRTFWPTWFAFDDVFLSAEHVPFLRRGFEQTKFVEAMARLPYFPVGRAPYYRFIGARR